jgi:Zn finger protein HypA/HybF involved in hydrogenase expression
VHWDMSSRLPFTPALMKPVKAALLKGHGARLDLEMVPGEGWCPDCSEIVSVEKLYDACRSCGQSHVRITAGEELRVLELEVE